MRTAVFTMKSFLAILIISILQFNSLLNISNQDRREDQLKSVPVITVPPAKIWTDLIENRKLKPNEAGRENLILNADQKFKKDKELPAGIDKDWYSTVIGDIKSRNMKSTAGRQTLCTAHQTGHRNLSLLTCRTAFAQNRLWK